MANTTRIESLNVLLDGSDSGKMLLKEAYDGVLENVQKQALSTSLKNTDLSGDPTAGTVEAKRFANAASQNYGTARTAGKGKAVKNQTSFRRTGVENIGSFAVGYIGLTYLFG